MSKVPFPGGYSSPEFSKELWKHLRTALEQTDLSLECYNLETVQLSLFARSDLEIATAEGDNEYAVVTVNTSRNEEGNFGELVSVLVIVYDRQVFEGEFSWHEDRYRYDGTIDDLARAFGAVVDDDDEDDDEDEDKDEQ